MANLENRGINLKCSIIIPPSLNIADVDLCILFGNLIDNAVEACERIVEPGRKKFIVLNVNIKKDYLFIDIANSFTGEVNPKTGNTLVTRADDTEEAIRKRIAWSIGDTLPLIEVWKKHGHAVYDIDASQSEEEIFREVERTVLEK